MKKERKLKAKNDTVITRSLYLPFKPYETTFAHIFLFLEAARLLDSSAHNTIKNNAMQCNAMQYNAIQHSTTKHRIQSNPIQSNTLHYTICFLGNLRSPGLKTVLKIERYAQGLTQGNMGDGSSSRGISRTKFMIQEDSAP